MSDKDIVCPLCGGQDLSPETDYASFEHHARFRWMGKKGLFGQSKDLTVAASKARICLDCGYLMTFVGVDGRRDLRTALESK